MNALRVPLATRVWTRSRWGRGVPMLEWNSMHEDREQKVAEIKDKVRRGEYEVDSKAVADAMLRRLTEEAFKSSARIPIAARSGR